MKSWLVYCFGLLLLYGNILTAQTPGNPYIDAGSDVTLDCTTGTCTDLTADFLDIGETNTYTVTSILFDPPVPFNGLSNSINTNIDDAWSGVENLPFDFCYFSNLEMQFQVGSNGVVRFDVDGADAGNGWSLENDIPDNSDDATGEANVFGVGHDIDPSVNNVNEIAWEVIGTAPNRILAVSYYEVPMYSCNNLVATHMMVFYETTNIIDVYIREKEVCASWNSGNSLVGIQNDAGTEAFVPPGRNTNDPNWTTFNEAWRFTPSGPSVVDFAWLDSNGDVVSTSPTMNVCPSDTETYTARATYTNCNGEIIEVTDDVTVTVNTPFTYDLGANQDLCEGDADVLLDADINSGTATYQWTLNGTDLIGETNPTFTVTSPNSGTYGVTVSDQGCDISDSVEITFHSVPVVNPITDYVLCDDNNDDVMDFELGLKYAEILGGQSDVTVTFHETQSDADNNTNALSDVSYTNLTNPQTIYVRLENDNNPSCFVTTTFQLIVSYITFSDPISDLHSCDDDLDGFTNFTLTDRDQEAADSAGLPLSDVLITYHASQADADSGINALASPYTNVTNPQTIYLRVEQTTNAMCYGVTSFDLVVDPLPVITTPSLLEVCDDAVMDGFTAIDLTIKNTEITGGNPDYGITYHETQADADGDVNPLPVPYTNVSNPQTVFVRVEDINTGCYTTTPLDVEVVQRPTVNTPSPLEYCDGDNDGIGTFTLTDVEAQVLGGQTGLVVSYHETLSDAQTNVNAQTDPYTNIVPYNQTIYVRVESATVATPCETVVELELIVYDSPVLPDPIEDFIECDTNSDGVVQFDLTQKDAELYGGQDPITHDLTYHQTQSDADSGSNAIDTSVGYTNLSNPQTLYVRLEDTTTGCFRTGSFDLVVNLPPGIVQPTPYELCDDEVADEVTVFDLTLKDAEITSNNGSWQVQYYETNADAQADTNAIDPATAYTNQSVGGNPPNPQTLYVRVTDTDTGCTAFTTLTLRVLPNPTPGQDPPDLELCDDNATGDMAEAFDLTTNETYIINGELGVSATYHETLADAESGDNPLTSPYTNVTNPQTIYVRVTNDTTGCYALESFDLIVHPLPEVTEVDDMIICEDNTDGLYAFDLDSQTTAVLNGQDPMVFTVTYHDSQADAEAGMDALVSPYINTANPQEIFVRIENTTTGCDVVATSFFIAVQEAAEANSDGQAIVYALCDDNMEFDGDPSNDSVSFDLTTQDGFILDGQDPGDYTVSYYVTQSDAELGVNAISPATDYMNVSNPQTIYARVDNDSTPDAICYEVTSLELRVDPLPAFDLEDEYILCVDTNGTEEVAIPLLDTGLSTTDYSFVWYLNGTEIVGATASSLTPTQGGSYTVEVTTTDGTNCTSEDTATVTESSPPVVTATVTTQAFAGNHIIEVSVTGTGVYEYSLDNGPWQESNIFEGVTAGEHVVTVRDLNGCGYGTATVLVIDYPLYFTPNNDGYHDTWNIIGASTLPSAKIYIFDRLGKLLKQLSPMGQGWDGTYNGELLPSSDYWFVVEFDEPLNSNRRTFKAHFALKR